MKVISIFSIVAIFMVSCNSNSSNQSGASSIETNKALYERALGLEDYGTALVALNYILLEDTTNLEYTDSLARLYMRSGSFDAGLQLGYKVMDAQPKNYKLLELIATAEEYKADPIHLTKSYKSFKKLYEEVGGARYLIKLAQIGMLQGNMEPALKRLDEVIADPNVTMIESPTRNGGVQMIDVKAAAYFLKANYELNLGNAKGGGDYLNKALQISPKYEAASLLVQDLQRYQQQMASQGQQMNQQQVIAAQRAAAEKQRAAELEAKRYEEFMKNKK